MDDQCGMWQDPCGQGRPSGKDRQEEVRQTMEVMQLLLVLERGLWFGYGSGFLSVP
jgi:hypothetical protein